jgi:hypothetical protein
MPDVHASGVGAAVRLKIVLSNRRDAKSAEKKARERALDAA